MICEKCHIEYDESKRFCRNCGSPLSATKPPSSEDGSHPLTVQRVKIIRMCPKCHLHFEVGNYCRICGFSLKQEITFSDRDRIDNRLIKRLSSDWSGLRKKKSELETCLGKLEQQRDAFSEETFNPIFQRYEVQIESLSCRLKEITARFESFRATVSKEIGFLEEEAAAIQKRFEEIRSLHHLGAITHTDYFAEKKGIRDEMRSSARRLKECKKTISLLTGPFEEGSGSPALGKILLRPEFSSITAALLILFAVGVHLLATKNVKTSQSQGSIEVSDAKPVQAQLPVIFPEAREEEKIKSLFETIRRANLEKKIDLFMSCYAADFKGRSEKRLATVETWNNFDYLNLSYDLKSVMVKSQIAQVRVEWRIGVSPKDGRPLEKTTSLLDVTLKKEDGHWKIEEIKRVS